jgi:hypothetical protein
MSDETTPDETTPDETAPDETAPDEAAARPSRPATPTSRARRIGGRPMPFPQADAPDAAARETTDRPGRQSAAPAGTQAAKPSLRKSPPAADEASQGRARGAARATTDRPHAAGADLAAVQRRLDQLRWVPAVVAALAVVAMLVVGAWQAHGVWWGKRLGDTRTQQQQEVLATAKSCTAAVLSYDYRNLDKAQEAAEACITPAFKAQYEQTFTVVKQLAPQKKAVITFQVANGGVQSVSKDGSQWVVLLYGQSAYADSTTKGNPRLDVSSPIVTLTKVDGRYLVSNLNTS